MRHSRPLATAVLALSVQPLALGQSVAAPPEGLAASSAAAGSTEGKRDYAQISLEDLLNKDVAVAATKTRVDVAKAPVSVTVITPDDIRRSGASRVAEVLRTVPGLDVLEAFPGHVSVSARGTSEIFVNNMLVLIDGRRLEQQANGVAWFEKAPLRIEDVKRIEVIKGPVGAIYGTNALAGIISITTFSPGEVPGTFVALSAGERDSYEATLRQADVLGASGWSYKLVGGYSYTSTWSSLQASDSAPPVALRKAEGVLLLERQFGDESRLSFEGGYARGDMASLTLVVPQTRYFRSPHVRVAYGRSDFHAQLTYSPQDIELRERTGPVQVLTDRAYAAGLTADRTFRPSGATTVTLGGDARRQRTTFTNLGPAHVQTVWNVFGLVDQALADDRVHVLGALGLGDHPEIPTQVDGNAAIVLSPAKAHSIRLSFGRAHRDPSFGENYFDFPRRYPGNRDGYQSGNTNLAPETLVSWEAGYHGQLKTGGSTLRVFAEGFRQDLKGLIAAPIVTVPRGSIAGHPTATVLQRFQNLEDRRGWGFETGLGWGRGGLQFTGQYSYQRFENAETGAVIVRDVPKHKTSGGLRYTRGAFELDVWAHAVSRTVEDDGYVLVNPRLGVSRGGWTLALQAFNALDDKHIETANATFKGETLRRAVTVSLTRRGGAGHGNP